MWIYGGNVLTQPVLRKQFVFFDESTLCTNGLANCYNCSYWTRDSPTTVIGLEINPNWMIYRHTKHYQKGNVWTRIITDRIIIYFIYFFKYFFVRYPRISNGWTIKLRELLQKFFTMYKKNVSVDLLILLFVGYKVIFLLNNHFSSSCTKNHRKTAKENKELMKSRINHQI